MSEATFARLFYTNLLASTVPTLTASDANTEFPANNLLGNNYSATFRSTQVASAVTIVADFGAAVSVAACALGNINVGTGSTVHIQGHTADSWGSPDVDETFTVSAMDGTRRNLYKELATTYSKRYWRISITDTTNDDGFIELGAWWLGTAITLNDNYDANFTRQIVRPNVSMRTEYNQAYVYQRGYNWQFDFTWTNVQLATLTQLRALSVACGGDALPFFFVLDPTTPSEAFYVRLVTDCQEQRVDYDRYNTKLSMMEETPGLAVPR